MKYASSMRYGGDLVDAAECDYEDYKYLGLLCPECKDAVFLRASGSRVVKGREIQVGAHFCHFPGKDASLVAQCENRVSKYTPKELQRRAAVVRGQRLKLLQQYFWSILSTRSNIIGLDDAVAIFEEWNQDIGIVNAKEFFGEKAVKFFKQNLARNKRQADATIEMIQSPDFIIEYQLIAEDYTRRNFADRVNIDFWKKLKIADERLQKKIVYEILDFLVASSSFDLLNSLFMGVGKCVFSMFDEGNLTAEESVVLNTMLKAKAHLTPSHKDLVWQFLYIAIIDRIIMSICCVDWSKEFAKLQKSTDRIAS